MTDMTRNATNQLLHKAKKLKSDEFYTQYCDIERELKYYPDCFRGKVVYCNCDDPYKSNFFRYFVNNFHSLGLRELISSCYQPFADDIFHAPSHRAGFFCRWKGEDMEDSISTHIKTVDFQGDGDFRSKECVELLRQSDIIVTNPPFSLFRQYVAQLIDYGKQFLIIGNINALTYKGVFELIQSNKAWLGVNFGRGISGFIVPDDYEAYGTETTTNSKGEKIIATNSCFWLTNLEHCQRHINIVLSKKYYGNENEYPKYDNCNAINVNKTQNIPKDYNGLMGVPVTFLHKYNPDQFELVRFRKGEDGKDLCIKGKCPYFRILIRKRAVTNAL